MKREGGVHNCWVNDFKFGDFNNDGFVDIYIDGTAADKVEWLRDGAIYMSNGKFTYDVVQARDEDYPLIKLEIKKSRTKLKPSHIYTDFTPGGRLIALGYTLI